MSGGVTPADGPGVPVPARTPQSVPGAVPPVDLGKHVAGRESGFRMSSRMCGVPQAD